MNVPDSLTEDEFGERRDAIEALFDEQCAEDGAVERYDGGDVLEDTISEGSDNGCYVLAWVWVSFEGSHLDKKP